MLFVFELIGSGYVEDTKFLGMEVHGTPFAMFLPMKPICLDLVKRLLPTIGYCHVDNSKKSDS